MASFLVGGRVVIVIGVFFGGFSWSGVFGILGVVDLGLDGKRVFSGREVLGCGLLSEMIIL